MRVFPRRKYAWQPEEADLVQAILGAARDQGVGEHGWARRQSPAKRRSSPSATSDQSQRDHAWSRLWPRRHE